jgi:hypothetical protein
MSCTQAANVSLITQKLQPASLTAPASGSVFCSRYSPHVLSASQDSYYQLHMQLSTSATSTTTFDITAGDYVSAVSVVCGMPAVVNVPVSTVNSTGADTAAGGGGDPGKFRGLVPAADSTTAGIGDDMDFIHAGVVRENAGNLGYDLTEAATKDLARSRNMSMDFAAYFCDYFGARLVHCVEVLLNGDVVQAMSGTWLFIFNELYRDAGKKAHASLGHAEQYNTNGLNRREDIRKAKKVSALSGTDLEIELPVFFESTACGAFPRFLFGKSDALQLRLTFNALDSGIANSSGLGDSALTMGAGAAGTIGFQTVTVPNHATSTSAVADYLIAKTTAPTPAEFRADCFTIGLRIRETYVDSATLKLQSQQQYRVVVPHARTYLGSAENAHSRVVLDAMASTPLPVHSHYVFGRLLENTLTKNWFDTAGPMDQLTGVPQSSIAKMEVLLGNNVAGESSSKNLFTRRMAAQYASAVSHSQDIWQFNHSTTNPFPEGGLAGIPRGCVDMSAMAGSGIHIMANPAAFRDHALSSGNDYGGGRGKASGNAVDIVCTTLFMNTLTVTPKASDPGAPDVKQGVDLLSAMATRRRTQ